MRELKLFALVTIFAVSAQGRILETGSPVTEKSTHVVPTNIGGNSTVAVKWEGLKATVSGWLSSFGGNTTPKQPVVGSAANSGQSNSNPTNVNLPNVPSASSSSVSNQNSQIGAQSGSAISQTSSSVNKTDIVPKALPASKNFVLYAPTSVGRVGDTSLKKSAAGVPVFDLVQTKKGKGSQVTKIKVSNIPLLDIGDESQLAARDFVLPAPNFPIVRAEPIEVLKSPTPVESSALQALITLRLDKAAPPQKIALSFLEGEEVVTKKRVDAVNWIIGLEPQLALHPYERLSEEDLRALRALILVDKKDMCHVATGILHTLVDSKNETYRTLADLHLGMCAHEMGLFSESVGRLLTVIRKGKKEYVGRAIEKVVTDLPREFEVEVAKAFREVESGLVSEGAKDSFHYILAKGLSVSGDFKSAEKYAASVSKKSDRYPEAQYILAVSEYSNGKTAQSLEHQKAIFPIVENDPKKKDLSALIAMNLGRTAFQNRQYDEASQYYMKIRKDNPFWVQALTEQGWAQLQKKDAEGAIGNMYSIHSPYFKMVYKPESYVVRTIGYLNICQYGDAYRTLSQLEAQYRPWNSAIESYMARKPAPLTTYSSMVTYLKSPSVTVVDGMPAQVLREMGRNRDFLNVQAAINNRVDEMEQYNFITNLIEKDKDKVKLKLSKSLARITELEVISKKPQTELNGAGSDQDWKQQLTFEKLQTEFFTFKMSVMEEGKRGLGKFKEVAKTRLVQSKENLKVAAGQILNKRLKSIASDLLGILDNNELLRYEVFAASGENIRFHLTAGESGESEIAGSGSKGNAVNRVPASMKPKSKELQWAFDGEYWEDEIGNYRSSLKNNCPKGAGAAAMNR